MGSIDMGMPSPAYTDMGMPSLAYTDMGMPSPAYLDMAAPSPAPSPAPSTTAPDGAHMGYYRDYSMALLARSGPSQLPKLPCLLSVDDMANGRDIFPIGKGHAILDAWHGKGGCLERIVDLLDGLTWNSVNAFRVGWENPTKWTKPVPTILITVYSLSVQLADDLADRCRCLLQKSFKLGDVAVEIAQGNATHGSSAINNEYCNNHELWRLHNTWHMDHNKIPIIGTGIGVAGTGGLGTLGFYVRITKGDKSEVMAATCHHVVDPPKGTRLKLAFPIRACHGVVIESRSLKDQMLWETYLQHRRHTAESMRQVAATQLGRENLENMLVTALNARLAKFNEEIAAVDKMMADQGSRSLGKVFLSSGLPGPFKPDTDRKYAPDWALIRLDSDRVTDVSALTNIWHDFIFHKHPGMPPSLKFRRCHPNYHPKYYATEALASKLKHGGPITVYKFGLSTSATSGRLNELMSKVLIFNTGRIPTYSLVWVVLGEFGAPGGGWFSRPGDSGSLVVDVYGTAVGMVVARRVRTYVMPMEAILDMMREALEVDFRAEGEVQVDLV
ncbi:hypothetical protein QBC33DRAFT_520415 [Phialemonium atrogriseum]|uniref:Uncharacterized protein n=1 Tax=Phialemonium atrogriseum TaxID=1093897 RepID=A0AAJ0C8K8_9PEZI|nr:uncharacterized protein QBC33DRAFT_520415 [Phialemonium atrogriseum]KAK1772163.1 hypothetical protein QBC33DRAFT_520415 [Phialemonium atrogriseum]